MPQKSKHTPVLANTILQLINKFRIDNHLQQLGVLDLTLGEAGHSVGILKKVDKLEYLISFDWNKASIKFVTNLYSDLINSIVECDTGCMSIKQKTLNSHNKWYLAYANFIWADKVLKFLKFNRANVVLADLGPSTRQLLNTSKGFSVHSKKGVLDLRMAPEFQKVTGFMLLNGLSKKELRDLFMINVGMPQNVASLVSTLIIKERNISKFGNQNDIKRLEHIADYLKKRGIWRFAQFNNHKPLTLLLLGLRMAVNSERPNVLQIMSEIPDLVTSPNLILIIGFHSGEWELLEHVVPEQYHLKLLDIIVPSNEEQKLNPSSRSAKLFVYNYV